jgi:hypothetical protein
MAAINWAWVGLGGGCGGGFCCCGAVVVAGTASSPEVADSLHESIPDARQRVPLVRADNLGRLKQAHCKVKEADFLIAEVRVPSMRVTAEDHGSEPTTSG